MSANPSSSPAGLSTFSPGRSASPTSSVGGSTTFNSEAVAAAITAATASVLGLIANSLPSEFPAYLTHPVLTHLCTAGNIDPLDVAADHTEAGEGASADNASECKDFDAAFVEADMEKAAMKAETAVVDEGEVPFYDVKRNSPLITLPGAPDSWKAATTKTAKDEPAFPQVDNPDGWSEFTFHPTFATTKKGGM